MRIGPTIAVALLAGGCTEFFHVMLPDSCGTGCEQAYHARSRGGGGRANVRELRQGQYERCRGGDDDACGPILDWEDAEVAENARRILARRCSDDGGRACFVLGNSTTPIQKALVERACAHGVGEACVVLYGPYDACWGTELIGTACTELARERAANGYHESAIAAARRGCDELDEAEACDELAKLTAE